MTVALRKSRYTARLARSDADVALCQGLRHLSFFGSAGIDSDRFDAACTHLMVEDRSSAALVATARIMTFANGADIHTSYAAQSYDLAKFSQKQGRFAEVGRFCLRPGPVDSDILRVAWAALTRIVDDAGIDTLFGCSSFDGTAAECYASAFGLLYARHAGPHNLRPKVKAAETLQLSGFTGDAKAGMAQMPPLLKTYLIMGGWVSDHAVIDRAMNTMHVFTALDIATVPPVRAKALRALAQMI